MSHEMKHSEERTARNGVDIHRIVMWAGAETCWVCLMIFMFSANAKSSGFDALMVSIFAYALGRQSKI